MWQVSVSPRRCLDVVARVDVSRWFTTTRTRNVVVVAVIVLAGMAAADWFLRSAEFRGLVTAAEEAADAIDEWEAGRDRITADLPGAFYLTPQQRQDTDRQLRREAADATMSLADAATRVREVRVALPWHRDVEQARNRYLDHIDAWTVRLRRAARDPSMLQEPAPDIAATRSTSERAFRDALPPVALHGLDGRVEALFDGQAAPQ